MTKNILITGASRGIGRAAALCAAKAGWSVGVNYVANKTAADEVVRMARDAGVKAVAIPGDISVEADVLAMFDAAEQALGPLDGVVINAGILFPPSAVADMTADRIRRTFDVNTVGTYLCARESARRLAKGRGGRGGAIVFVSSIAQRLANPFAFLDYAGAKAAVDTLAIGLSKELGREGVRVNVVRPGIIETDIHASAGEPDRAEALGATTPMGRAGAADEVAEGIIWLLSDAASYTTGAILDITGGR